MKRFGFIALVLGITVIASLIAYFGWSEKEAANRAFAVGFLTLFVGGGSIYLVIYTKRMKQIEIQADELGENEVIWAKTTRIVHFKSGNPYKFWEGVGGKLFLTNHAVEFRANPAQWWDYQIKIPLRDIRRASACKIGFVSGGMRIERENGTVELFTFGAAHDISQEWAEAIMDFRDDLGEDNLAN